jgi:uncharacterized phage protein (TIGR02218 family)
MHALSPELQAYLRTPAAALCHGWKIACADGGVFGFTDYDRDVAWDGVTYLASPGMTPVGKLSLTAGLAASRVTLQGTFREGGVVLDAVRKGLFDGARTEFFLIAPDFPSYGRVLLLKGRIGAIAVEGNRFSAELASLGDAGRKTVGAPYGPLCRAALGDGRCGVALTPYRFDGVVVSVADARRVFSVSPLGQANGFFRYGHVLFSSGANAGARYDVGRDEGDTITLASAAAFPVAVGDAFTIQAGCDKRFATCIDKFNNALNFRGEPHLPGTAGLG